MGNNSEKKVHFFWSFKNNVVPLHPQTGELAE